MTNLNILSIDQNEEYIVVSLINNQGKNYEVGYPKSVGYSLELVTDTLNKKQMDKVEGSRCELKWEVNVKPSYTSDCAKALGISEGNVIGGISKIYQCRVQFHNTKGWGFTFYDLSGDDYSCSTFLNGWHYIDYNSSEPTIIAVD